MDYENVVDNLKTLKTQLDHIFKKNIERRNGFVSEEKELYDDKNDDVTAETETEETEEVTEESCEAEENSEEAETEEKSEEKKGFFKKKKDKKDEKIEELTDRVKRQMAEFDNFRKRTEKRKSFHV